MIAKMSNCVVKVALIVSIALNVVWIYYVSLRVVAVYRCTESIYMHGDKDFFDMDWRLRYFKSPCLISTTHRGLSYDSCFYCVDSDVFMSSVVCEDSDSPSLAMKRMFVGAPNYELSFEHDRDGVSRHVMLKYNDTVIDVDAMEDLR